MYEDTLRQHLNDIIDNLGINDYETVRKYKNYRLEITDKSFSSKSGDYTYKTQKIRITKTSSHNNANEVCTALHELAHHLDNCNRGTSGHGPEFYREYRQLIYSALDLGKITVEELKSMNHSNTDYRKVMKILNEYVRKKPIIELDEPSMIEVNVSGLGEKDPTLIAHGYQYNQRRKTWYINVSPDLVEYEQDMLSRLGITQIQLKDANTIQMLDDEAEYLEQQKRLAERKETLLAKSKREYIHLKEYIHRLVESGYEYKDLKMILDGNTERGDDTEGSFRFRFITLAGQISGKEENVELSDLFDIYEYREKDCRLVLRNTNINDLEKAVAMLQ